MPSDFRIFMTQLLRKPHQVVALAPSSQGLAEEMARRVAPEGGAVIELGAGTGKITRAILARGLPQAQLHAVEMNPVFCQRLRETLPGIQVHQMSAGDIGGLDIGPVQAVISGLPLLSMPTALQHAILGGAMAQLGCKGDYVQFTYGPKPPVTRVVREELSLSWEVSRRIWWNAPPARVFRFRQPENRAQEDS
ncbi:MAG: hypothetical protein AAF825_12810 [Pseudomonadota bacterium]